MFTKNQLLTSLILATISKVIMIAPASAFPDGPPPQSNNFVNFSSDSFVSGTSGEGIVNSISSNTSTETIMVGDIANEFVKAIDRSLNDLTITEISQQPQPIVRRGSAVYNNRQISRSSEQLESLLKQSEQFIKQVNQIKPENGIW